MGAATEATTTWAQALAWRLERQFLSPSGSESVAGVVRRLGAVLAMDQSLAELAVGIRRESARVGDLTAALADGEVIKAFAFRGAVHYLSPEEGGVCLALRSAGRQWELRSWVDFYRLAPADWPDFRAAVREAVSAGPLTVAALGEALAQHRAYRHLQPVFDDGAGTLIKPLTWQGDVSLGRSQDGQLTLQSLQQNPRWAGVPELAIAGPAAVTAYFATYGPAPLENLDHWLGGGLSAGRKRIQTWVAELDDRLVAVDVQGTETYVLREHVDSLLAAVPSEAVRLLPGHDQWVMGPGTKDVHVTPTALRDLMTRKANPVVLGGVVCGTWTRKSDDLTVTWLDERPTPDGAIEAEVSRLGEFLGRELRLDVSASQR